MTDEHSLRVLEFTRILDELGARCASPAGRARAASLRPSPEGSAVGALLAETAEALGLLRDGEPLPQSPLEDLIPDLRALKAGSEPWDGGRFLALLALLDASARLRRHLGERKDRAPTLFRKAEALPHLHPLAARIRKTVDERGEVRDEASPALARLRSRARALREEVRLTLERILEAHSEVVQEPLITQRRERYVLPLKLQFRRALEGVVHDRSASGHTLYVEPLEVCPLNNALVEVGAEEGREIYRILRVLTEAVREVREELIELSEAMAEFDLIAAKASLAAAWEGVVPEREAEWRVELRRARHPLLALSGRAVPVDIELGGPFRQLVITGPNTGGKTVALKTLGLLALLHQAGVPVPAAEGSSLPVFAEVFADIGDEQDLEQSLSTFSGHMVRVVEGMRRAREGVLLLLDELGTGTDPEEGGALGVAILEELARRGALVAVTTHHGALKRYAYAAPLARNASVEFDPVALKPTYRLLLGAPGPSNALVVAGRLGLERPVVERARELRERGSAEMEEVMARLAREEVELRERREEVEREQKRASRMLREAEAEAARLAEERAGLVRRLREEARRFLERARERVGALLEQLRERPPEAARGEARRVLGELESERIALFSPAPAEGAPAGGAGDLPIGVGDWVRVLPLRREGRVAARAGDGSLTVEVEGKTLRVGPEAARRAEPREGSPARVEAGWEGPEEPFEGDLYLLGERVEDALPRVDKYLDQAARLGLRSVRIVHGKGTGALREAVGAALQGHPLVWDFHPEPPERGGWGVTVVELGAPESVHRPGVGPPTRGGGGGGR